MRLRQRQSSGLQSSRMLSDQGGLTPEMAHPHASGGLLPLSSAVTVILMRTRVLTSGRRVEPERGSRGILKYNCLPGGKRHHLYFTKSVSYNNWENQVR